MSAKPPYIVEPNGPSTSTDRPATIIFLHGYGDDAEGIPLGLAQQFQFYNKIPYVKWILPNAPRNMEAMTTAWYAIKELPNPMKPRIPGDEDAENEVPDDEEGILQSTAVIDELVEQELTKGTPPDRIIVGGFSQGCAVSMVWGLIGKYRDQVAGVVCLSGYFPLAERIEQLRRERPAVSGENVGKKKWFYVHGTKDMLVPTRLFTLGKENLLKWIKVDDMEEHLYPGMGHSTGSAELRDMLGFFNKAIPP
ncbi:hypothetical protein PV10_02765 [Exophiala mesophila]|uniref:Acyl-protein thioesterase 1 n=1 Tax=Exophiala mesophila TaxID=212818 RepID=A0A0D1Y3B1_EXOME|nr:uncharacterized protein PV10_02765 [Exophiala mesophila]KIV95066.1 hypothetical protein PV10_02765 [Exophiala mesophila]